MSHCPSKFHLNKPMTMRFKDSVCVVVGGGSGIGAAVAVRMAREGARVAILDIDRAGATRTAGTVKAAGGEAIICVGDMSLAGQARSSIATVIEKWGQIDYLCNSAGKQTYGTVESTDFDLWRQTFAVNLDTIFLVSKYCIPHLIRRGGGAIVNVSSVQGLRCQTNVAAYAAAKGAVISLSRAMALDHAHHNIRVNCLCPGSVDTPMLRYGAGQHGPVDEVLAEWGKQHPIGRIGKAEEMAATVAFLLSEDAGFVLGQPIVADGGLMSRIL